MMSNAPYPQSSSASAPPPMPPAAGIPSHTGGAPLGTGHHRSSSSITSLSHLGLPSAPGGPGGAGSSGPNQTRVLLLSNFSPALKTKDLQDLLSEWQDDHGGLKVKWRDDTSAWVVFGDATVAKRAFLSLVSNPPLALSPSTTNTYAPCIVPYTGADVPQILQAVQNRPRSRSIAGQGATSGHARRNSGLGGSGGGAGLAALGVQGGQSPPPASAAPLGHNRTASWTRQSIDRRVREAAAAAGGGASSPSAIDLSSPSDISPFDGPDAPWRASSPETPGGPGGIVAGEAPRRFVNSPGTGAGHAPGVNGHRRTESRSGSDAVASGIAGLTINE